MKYPTTPDVRDFVVKGQLWRCTNPALKEAARSRLIQQLMQARRQVNQAKHEADNEALAQARTQVNNAKVALGERGPVWWTDGAPDYNRHKINNTPYANWYETLPS